MNIAMHTDLFHRYPIEKAIPLIAQAGYKYIELNAIPFWSPHINFFTATSEEKRNIKKLMDANDMKMAAIALFTDLAVLDGRERKRNVKYCIDAMDLARECGCNLICTCFSGNVLLSSQRQKTALSDSLKEISNIGLQNNIDIAIELHPGNFIDSTLRAINLIKSFDLPNVGYLFCCPHIVTYAGEDLEQALKLSKDHLFHFHLADTPICMSDHKHKVPQNGEIDFNKLIQKIKHTGYDRFLTLEIYSEDEHPLESAIESRKFIENLLK